MTLGSWPRVAGVAADQLDEAWPYSRLVAGRLRPATLMRWPRAAGGVAGGAGADLHQPDRAGRADRVGAEVRIPG